MGTWSTFDVAGAAEEAERRTLVDFALGAGTDLFDTSPMYGRSERVLAAALEERRDRAIVADKVWTSSIAEARRQIADALAWYGGRVEVYQVHNLVAWREHLPVLEKLRDGGKVKVVGVTHYSARAFDELMVAMRTGRFGMVQVPYSATNDKITHEVLPLAEDLGLGVLVMQPFDSGLLFRRPPSESELAPLAEFGVKTWGQALLKWILSDRRVHCAIPATRRPERAAENAAAGDPPWFDEDTRTYVAKLARRNA